MKATIFTVFALTAASVSVCAQPVAVPKEYNYAGVPRAVSELEARGWHINWRKVGHFAKDAAKFGASVLLRRMNEDELFARGFITKEDIVARDFDEDYLEARDFDDDHLEARDFGDDYLEARDFEDYLEERDFDDYLEQRDLGSLELRDDDDDKRPARYPHRLSRHGAYHSKKVSKPAAVRRPLRSRPAGGLDDVN